MSLFLNSGLGSKALEPSSIADIRVVAERDDRSVRVSVAAPSGLRLQQEHIHFAQLVGARPIIGILQRVRRGVHE